MPYPAYPHDIQDPLDSLPPTSPHVPANALEEPTMGAIKKS